MEELPLSGRIRNVHIAIEAELNRQMKDYELTATQSMALKYIVSCEKDEINQVDVEKHLKCSNPTVAGIVKRLEEKDLVACVNSARDKRFKKLLPTEKSRRLIALMDKRVDQLNERITRGISEEEVSLLQKLLEKMEKNLLAK